MFSQPGIRAFGPPCNAMHYRRAVRVLVNGASIDHSYSQPGPVSNTYERVREKGEGHALLSYVLANRWRY